MYHKVEFFSTYLNCVCGVTGLACKSDNARGGGETNF